MKDEYQDFVKELYSKFDKFQVLEKDNEEFLLHFRKWQYFEFDDTLKKLDDSKNYSFNTPGRIFLYEKFIISDSEEQLHYPKIGVYINGIPCDQTIDVEWIDWRRSWEYNRKFSGTSKFCYLPSVVQNMPIFVDYLLIYGVWDKLPNWKELKKAYERTWWFHKTIEEKRDILIEQLIK